MRFVWVGVAGGFGSMVRYALGLAVQSRFPWTTVWINISGSFVLGLFLTLALGRLPTTVTTPVAVGLIGGFTTFSTFAWESLSLGRNGRFGEAIAYISLSVFGGLVAAWLGYSLGRFLQ